MTTLRRCDWEEQRGKSCVSKAQRSHPAGAALPAGRGQRAEGRTAQISLPQLGVVHHHAAFSPGAANEEE